MLPYQQKIRSNPTRSFLNRYKMTQQTTHATSGSTQDGVKINSNEIITGSINW